MWNMHGIQPDVHYDELTVLQKANSVIFIHELYRKSNAGFDFNRKKGFERCLCTPMEQELEATSSIAVHDVVFGHVPLKLCTKCNTAMEYNLYWKHQKTNCDLDALVNLIRKQAKGIHYS